MSINFLKEHNRKKKFHKNVSYIKSTIRIIGYILLPISLLWGAVILVVSEILGYLEEIYEN